MEGIEHRMVSVNGINMHIAEKGEGPVVLFLHGFPELWYSWRHQITSLASHGYRAVAPDLRGCGDTDSPPSSSSYTVFHIVGDLIALINLLDQDQVFVVGHDWGAYIAWCFCLFRPDRVKALVNLSVAFIPRNPSGKPLDLMRAALGDDYYFCRFQKPGDMEEVFARFGSTGSALKRFITSLKAGPLFLPKGKEFGDSPDHEISLPSWLSEEDINYYASKFNIKGFTGGLNYYRSFDMNWELMAPWTGVQVKVPVKFVVGELDIVYNTLNAKEYIHGGGFKSDVPFLEDVVVMEGVGHFINQERPDEINTHILDFIKRF
ncbi:epoxide hydrolase A-like [Telopea speciosissima]|uniref:epoxide hydrolase A-like n=1 Tax=Telopea speciosissima TaxID=54955 RepID=UPI001CC7094C|nr:epoxide hydrolase A-like [Telopea speciosissima]XP_043708881.1 epoxide hydrolase A-like [Telopea speciosissima]